MKHSLRQPDHVELWQNVRIGASIHDEPDLAIQGFHHRPIASPDRAEAWYDRDNVAQNIVQANRLLAEQAVKAGMQARMQNMAPKMESVDPTHLLMGFETKEDQDAAIEIDESYTQLGWLGRLTLGHTLDKQYGSIRKTPLIPVIETTYSWKPYEGSRYPARYEAYEMLDCFIGTDSRLFTFEGILWADPSSEEGLANVSNDGLTMLYRVFGASAPADNA